MESIELEGVKTITVGDSLSIEKTDDEIYLTSRINPNIIDGNFNELEDKIQEQETQIKLISERVTQLAEIINSLIKIVQE